MFACARLAALALLLTALPPSAALAHEGNPNFRSEIEGLRPAAPGIEVAVLNLDDSLRLENDGDEAVVVKGYDGEPYVRISPDGTVEVNRRSPSRYLNEDRFAQIEVPAIADPDAEPDWELVDRSGQFSWHDHRIHYMARGTPPQVTDEGERTKVFDYQVPLEVGERRVRLLGSLYWVGGQDGFPIAPFLGLGALALLAGAAIVIIRRRRAGRAAEAGGPREAW
jgi:hypothetical protein